VFALTLPLDWIETPMADLALAPPRQQMKGSGFAAVLGLFAGLCAIFAGCVALGDWYSEATHARWPLVSAVVERAEVVAFERNPKNGAGTSWHIESRVRFEVDGKLRTATPTSRGVFSETEAAWLQSWAEQHGNGSEIDVRYDPSRQNLAVFASAELSPVAGRTRNDLVIFSIAAFACAALLTLSKYLRVREARANPVVEGQGRALALVVAAIGLEIAGSATYGAMHATPFVADNFIGVPAGLMFVFAGILIGLPPGYDTWRNWLTTLLMSCFALTFDWVAFGPGEREFSGSAGGFGFVPSEIIGRIAFGFFAVILDVCAVGMWIGQFRRLLGLKSSGWFFGQKS
jgi:hypothetical protein